AARSFDSLRLRSVLAEAAGRLGLEDEECWRLAARGRVALAHAPSGSKGAPALEGLRDPDAPRAPGVPAYPGGRDFVKGPFARRVWWRALPALLGLAAERSPSPKAIRALERGICAATEVAAVAGYRLP